MNPATHTLPLVSIIIPCYNSQAFVGRAIQSVQQQLYPNWELLLVDNGSTDDTLPILERYAAEQPARIRVLQQPRKGAPAARNMGAAAAKGLYLQFLDSDDELTPEKLAVQMDVQRTEQVAIVAGSITKVMESESGISTSNHPCLREDVWLALVTTGLGRTSSLLFEKQAFLNAGGWNEAQTSSQEYELLFRMLSRGARLSFSDGFHTRIYLRPNSVHASTDPVKKARICGNYIGLRVQVKQYLLKQHQFSGAFSRRFNHHMLGYLAHMKHDLPDLYRQSLVDLGIKPTALYYIRKLAKKVKRTLTR